MHFIPRSTHLSSSLTSKPVLHPCHSIFCHSAHTQCLLHNQTALAFRPTPSGSEAQHPNHCALQPWLCFETCSTTLSFQVLHLFLTMEGLSEAVPSAHPRVSLIVPQANTKSGCSDRYHLTPWAHSFTVSLASSFQTIRWMASHFDDLFKQFVRSTVSCTHMIQNINVCCRCNFSCQLMHQEKMTFIPERCNFFINSNSQCPGEAISRF